MSTPDPISQNSTQNSSSPQDGLETFSPEASSVRSEGSAEGESAGASDAAGGAEVSADEVQTDFEALARFLMSPFLDQPGALKFHVENLAGGKKLWLRAAFDEAEDKGRVFGRGGRNIQAVRTVLSAAAQLAGRTVNLSIFGEPSSDRSERSDRGGRPGGGRSRSGEGRRARPRSEEDRPPRPSTHPAPPKKKPK